MSTVRLYAPKTQNLETTSAEFVWECSVLSAHIYDASVPLPPGWISLIDYYGYIADGDYRGGCFVKYGLDKPNGIVMFASRGTANFQNLIDDFNLWLGRVIGHVENVYNKQMKILMDMGIWDEVTHEIKNPSLAICQTGHSLGGVFADILNCMANINANGKSITFENPGSLECLIAFMTSKDWSLEYLPLWRTWCEAYQADVNAINTCKQQMGKTFRVMGIPYDFLLNIPLVRPAELINYLTDNFYKLGYTLQQHAIDTLSNTIKEKHIFEPHSYPVGLNNSYLAYLDVEKRKDYWDGYLKTCWDIAFPELKIEYLGNWEKFYEDSITHIKALSTKLLNIQQLSTLKEENKELLAINARLFNSNSNKLKVKDFVILEPDNVKVEERRCLIM